MQTIGIDEFEQELNDASRVRVNAVEARLNGGVHEIERDENEMGVDGRELEVGVDLAELDRVEQHGELFVQVAARART